MAADFDGIPLIPSRAAMDELMTHGRDLHDVLDVLESGYDCPRSRRGKDVVERCLDSGNVTLRAVVARSYSYSIDSEVWVLIHFGVTTRRK